MFHKLIATLVFSLFSWANALDAHSHGELELKIQTVGTEMVIFFHGAADGLIGFENKPTSLIERQMIKNVENDWRSTAFGLLNKGDLKSCKATSSNWRHKFSSANHSSLNGDIYIKCPWEIKNKTMNIDIMSKYTGLEVLKVKLLKAGGKAINKKFTSKRAVLLKL